MLRRLMAAVLLAAAVAPAHAIIVNWTDWQSASGNTAFGQLDVGGTLVDITLVGNGFGLAGVQTGTGTNYWTEGSPPPYTGGAVENAPPAAELVSLDQGGTVTITFSQPISDVYLALNSWNGNTVDFGEPISFVSFGRGFWGSGTPILNAAGTGFFGQGEVHGILLLSGPHSGISFTHTSENWHGLTIGAARLAGTGPSVPEPPVGALVVAGVLAVAWVRRRRLRMA